jgi:hypothetical protein
MITSQRPGVERMNMITIVLSLALAVGLLAACIHAAELPAAVGESARAIPVAYDVDVVVVGGSSGAVSAAVAAAEKGAKVFVAAPRPYLGEDLCATLRLWLEEGETPASPLAKKLYAPDAELSATAADPNLLLFKYEASLPSAGVHKDTTPPSPERRRVGQARDRERPVRRRRGDHVRPRLAAGREGGVHPAVLAQGQRLQPRERPHPEQRRQEGLEGRGHG